MSAPGPGPGPAAQPQPEPLLAAVLNNFTLRHVSHAGQGIPASSASPTADQHTLEYACLKALATAAYTRTAGRELAQRVLGEEFAKRIRETLVSPPAGAAPPLAEMARLPEFSGVLRCVPPEAHGVRDVRALFDYMSDTATPFPLYAVVTNTRTSTSPSTSNAGSNAGSTNPTAVIAIRAHPLECPLYILYTPRGFASPADAWLTVVSPGCEGQAVRSLVQKLTGGNGEGEAGARMPCRAWVFRPALGEGEGEGCLPTPPPTPPLRGLALPQAEGGNKPPLPRTRLATLDPVGRPPPPPPPPPSDRTRPATFRPFDMAAQRAPPRPRSRSATPEQHAPPPRPASAPVASATATLAIKLELEHLRAENTRLTGEREHYWSRAKYWHAECVRRHEAHARAWDDMVKQYHSQLGDAQRAHEQRRRECGAALCALDRAERERDALCGWARAFGMRMHRPGAGAGSPAVPLPDEQTLDGSPRFRDLQHSPPAEPREDGQEPGRRCRFPFTPHAPFTGGPAPGDTRRPQARPHTRDGRLCSPEEDAELEASRPPSRVSVSGPARPPTRARGVLTRPGLEDEGFRAGPGAARLDGKGAGRAGVVRHGPRQDEGQGAGRGEEEDSIR